MYLSLIMRGFLLFLFCFTGLWLKAQSPFTFPLLKVEYDSTLVFRHLKLIPIKRIEAANTDTVQTIGKTVRLRQGMQKGLVQIRERGNYMVDNIHVLLIENKSNADLIIKSGEIVMGGHQDRVFARDTILPPGSKPYTVPVYCIEENRWSTHEKKFTYGGTTGAGLQTIIDTVHNQTKVWDEIRTLLKHHNQTSSSSYAALLNNRKIADSTQFYIRYFLKQFRSKDSSIVGFIASSGNKILGAEILISTSLFYQALPSLLSKYCTEAVLTGTEATEDLQREMHYANELLSPERQPEFLRKKGKHFYYKGVLIQVTGF
ncbi:MAG: ARPP-1 family domain-containing protein [Lacibacter sp.]